jgi:hypothetical protein
MGHDVSGEVQKISREVQKISGEVQNDLGEVRNSPHLPSKSGPAQKRLLNGANEYHCSEKLSGLNVITGLPIIVCRGQDNRRTGICITGDPRAMNGI